MKGYKRLSNPNPEEYDVEFDFCSGCQYHREHRGCNRPNGECGNYKRFCEMHDRLLELEDKIKDGRLIELPCKVGDILYTNFRVVGDYLREKDKPYAVKVVFIGVNNSEDMDGGYINVSYGENRFMWRFTFADIGESIFLTKLEAEEFV